MLRLTPMAWRTQEAPTELADPRCRTGSAARGSHRGANCRAHRSPRRTGASRPSTTWSAVVSTSEVRSPTTHWTAWIAELRVDSRCSGPRTAIVRAVIDMVCGDTAVFRHLLAHRAQSRCSSTMTRLQHSPIASRCPGIRNRGGPPSWSAPALSASCTGGLPSSSPITVRANAAAISSRSHFVVTHSRVDQCGLHLDRRADDRVNRLDYCPRDQLGTVLVCPWVVVTGASGTVYHSMRALPLPDKEATMTSAPIAPRGVVAIAGRTRVFIR